MEEIKLYAKDLRYLIIFANKSDLVGKIAVDPTEGHVMLECLWDGGYSAIISEIYLTSKKLTLIDQRITFHECSAKNNTGIHPAFMDLMVQFIQDKE